MKVGIKDISERTGYSVATVSNALNHKRGVNSETSSKIFQVAQELGYINSAKITRIRFITYKKNGLIVDDTPFFPALIDGVEKEARLSGYETVFNTLDRSSNDYEEQLSSILGDFSSALILLGTEMTEDEYKVYEHYTNPIIILDGYCNAITFDSVVINNADAAMQAAQHLLDKGHVQIGYLKGKFRIKNFTLRSMGLQQTLRRNNTPLQLEFVVPLTSTMEGAYRDMKRWLAKEHKLPTAFFADNDVIALGAIRALREYGYLIPNDVSVIGFDDLLLCEASTPRLTTIRVFQKDMGRLAVCRLVDSIKNLGGNAKTLTLVCTELVERESVLDINNY